MKRTMRRWVTLVIGMAGLVGCGTDKETKQTTVEVVQQCGPSAPNGACGAGETCFEGACVLSASLCSPTNGVGTCPSGMSCYAGGCVLTGALCSAANPAGACEIGDTCLAGTCVVTADLCSTSNPTGVCPSGQTCQTGVCGTPATPVCQTRFYSTQPTIGTHAGVTGKEVLTVDGHQFKDANGDGVLNPYEDWRLLEICRANDLVARMSLEQKIGIMGESSYVGSGTADGTIPSNVLNEVVTNHRRYALIRVGSRSAAELAVYLNNLQEAAEGEALGIPITITADPLHGFGMSTNAQTGAQTLSDSAVLSAWPYPLGLGAINDPALTEVYGDLVRREFMAMGFRWQLGPMADTATEPRWARVQNTFGENAFHVAYHVKAIVAGFQGSTTGNLRNGIAATMKHFPGAGPDEDGMDSHSYPGRFNVYPGDNFVYHFMPFQAAIDVGVAAVMPCYSIFKGQTAYDPDQVGAGFSHGLITKQLKQAMGFTGMVTADWGALSNGFGTASLSLPQRAAMFLAAGSHQLGMDNSIQFQAALDKGFTTEAVIDEASAKILEMTLKLGLFENPYVDPAAPGVRSVANRTAGFQAQKMAIVMAKNRAHEFPPYVGGFFAPPDTAPRYLPISGSRYLDARRCAGTSTRCGADADCGGAAGSCAVNGVPEADEYIDDVNVNGTVEVYFDGVVDGLVADAGKPDAVTDIFGEYDYTSPGEGTTLPVVQVDTLAAADIAVLRITARKGVYFGLDAGVPLSFDGPFPGTSVDSTIDPAITDRNRVIDALRVRDGYVNAAGAAVAATNPQLRIVLVMHMDRPGIVEPFIKGLINLDEQPGVSGSYPLVANVANHDPAGVRGVDALLVEFGAFDRAVLDFLFNANPVAGFPYGTARLPMELPSSDQAVDMQFEDLPSDSLNPTFMLGAGSSY